MKNCSEMFEAIFLSLKWIRMPNVLNGELNMYLASRFAAGGSVEVGGVTFESLECSEAAVNTAIDGLEALT